MKPNGVVLYEGPSVLDGSPIVCILTGLARPSQNEKTGPMLQTWILRADTAPTAAVADGSDVAVCGDCPLRGQGFIGRRCYVNIGNGPQAVWKAWKRGAYPDGHTDLSVWWPLPYGHQSAVRFGSYGDPAAVPADLWSQLAWLFENRNTGYTHQWRSPNFDKRILELCTASVETQADIEELSRLHPGARYFRVRLPGEAPGAREVECPASEAAGKRTTCYRCGLCRGGQIGRSVSIEAHGSSAVAKAWGV